MVHGTKNEKVDGGTAAALSNWRPETPKGPPKPTFKLDKDQLYGMPSQ